LRFVFHTGLYSGSLRFLMLIFPFILYLILDSIGDDFFFDFFLTKWRLEQFAMVKLDDFNFLFLFVENMNDGGGCVIDF
jgi:hypothetical protein